MAETVVDRVRRAARGVGDRLSAAREDARNALVRGPVSGAAFEAATFVVKQAWACVFGVAFLTVLLLTFAFYPSDATLARYDFLVLAALAIQGLLLATKLETWEEARVIAVFHVVGTLMELFKTQMGSWTYPEDSLLRIGDVPLFSGFMYAAVGSYIARAWRIFDVRFDRFPPLWAQGLLGAAIYANFFTHHFIVDLRWVLFVATAALYGPCVAWLRIDHTPRPVPLVVAFAGVALLIWIAENVATYGQAWIYPSQHAGWVPVGTQKLGAWYLLMIISFVLVALVHGGRDRKGGLGAQ